jgi:hypothetical protein
MRIRNTGFKDLRTHLSKCESTETGGTLLSKEETEYRKIGFESELPAEYLHTRSSGSRHSPPDINSTSKYNENRLIFVHKVSRYVHGFKFLKCDQDQLFIW